MSQSNFTFWELIKESSIEIPTIQRDYTYGRKSAEDIRKKLIRTILGAVTGDQSKTVHLDFVYGKRRGVDNHKMLEKNQKSIDTLMASIRSYAQNLHIDVDYKSEIRNYNSAEIITFIPLDGQQRLTTLFLIHWSLNTIVNDLNASEILKRFTYKTRNSSKEFLSLLCSSNLQVDFTLKEKISEQIELSELFFKAWKKDPTVRSMLSVLNEIQHQFNELEIDHSKAWNNIIENRKVTFDFFDLEDFELTDELYLKMNARGKKLSDFENFKAWLIKARGEFVTIDRWKKKFDLDWNDFFWDHKAEGVYSIDEQYLQYFKNLFLGDYIKEFSEEELATNTTFDELRIKKEFNPVRIFEKSEVFKDKINNYLTLLDLLNNDEVQCGLNPAFKGGKWSNIVNLFVRDNRELNWWDSTLFYALSRYIINSGNNLSYFNQWLRFISNLIYNTPIESPRLYKEACASIDELIKKFETKEIYPVLASMDANEIDFFLEKQKEEEILKANYLINDTDGKWESLIHQLEQNFYFYGQIGFIISKSDFSYEDFKLRSKKIRSLFSEQILKDKEFKLFRALLIFGGESCFFIKGRNLSYPVNIFGTLRNRNENWRRFIQYHSDAIDKLIDSPDFDENAPLESIDKLLKSEISVSPFIEVVVRNSEILKYPEQNYIRKYNNGYYLLNSSRISGYYVECYTYDWFKRNSYQRVKYQYGKGEDSLGSVGLKWGSDLIVFNRDSGRFETQDRSQDYASIDEAIKTLEHAN